MPLSEATVPKVTVITRKAYGGPMMLYEFQNILEQTSTCLAKSRKNCGNGRQRASEIML